MEDIDFRKAIISGALTAGSSAVMNTGSGTPVQNGIRGAAISVGTDVVGGFANYNTEDNLVVTSAIAGGLNAAYGRWNSSGMGGGNLTRDFFMGALMHAAAGTIANSLEDRGGIPGMLQNGINMI